MGATALHKLRALAPASNIDSPCHDEILASPRGCPHLGNKEAHTHNP